MQLVAPVSTCLEVSAKSRHNLRVLGQYAKQKKNWVYLNGRSIDGYQAQSQKPQLQLQPVALGDLVARLETLAPPDPIVLLTSSPSFDTTPYDNLVRSLIHHDPPVYICTLNCYGHALAYMVEGVLRFVHEQAPSPQQLTLFVEALNNAVNSFIVCPRAAEFEPELGAVNRLWSRLTRATAVYQAQNGGWSRSSLEAIGRTVERAEQDKRGSMLVWVDSRQDSTHAQRTVQQLQSWGWPEKWIVHHPLHHVSRTFPSRFALITIAPRRAAIEQIGNLIMRWGTQDSAVTAT